MVSVVIGTPVATSRLPKVLKYTGWPRRWIRTMAPGILPEAISPLRKSSIRWSFSTDSSAPGGGPNADAAAGNDDGGHDDHRGEPAGKGWE